MYQTVRYIVDTPCPYIHKPGPCRAANRGPNIIEPSRILTRHYVHTYLADRNYSVITTSMAHGSKTEISCQKRKKKRDSVAHLSSFYPSAMWRTLFAPFSPPHAYTPSQVPLSSSYFPNALQHTCNGYFGLPNGQSPFREIALQLRQPPPMHAVITSCTVHMFI